ncbi:MAG TPA: arsinothricin resistance N-acetyltransferase ArsN1 family B [Chitinophagaceae bacterium]|nr:arsinothricin resistance N-acetyltransferase ArsN1 family B [Chitinophagaceae bacterium]
MIRLATPGDAPGILDIYAPYVRETSITFETEPPALDAFTSRIMNCLQNYPWLVYENEGKIAGYAYAMRHRERTAYQWSVECSVYIHNDYHRKGIATALYTTLLSLLTRQGFTNVYAVINLPNDRSVALHEKLGFRYFATFEKVGFKLGEWKNVGWWRLQVNEYAAQPSPPLPFSELDRHIIDPLLHKD